MRPEAREEELRKIWQARFSQTPFDCGRDAQPGVDETPEWRDWSHLDTTQDQQRIEAALDRMKVGGRSILHIGVGNSKLAEHFHSRASYIFGITISESELRHGEGLGIRNYDIVLRNKYSEGDLGGRAAAYDYIVDNNPTTFCCCWRHLTVMMDQYARLLSPSGRLLTDKVGLGWVTSDPSANPRWSFTYEDWKTVGRAFGLEAGRVNQYVYSLSPRSGLRRASFGVSGLADRLRGIVRSAVRLGRPRP